MRRFSRRLALTALGVVVFGTLVAFGAGAGATGTAALAAERPVDRVVMFASDGMRPDLMEKYANAGAMPTYKKLMTRRRDRQQRDAPGLPAEHRRRLVHDGDRHVPVRARLDEQHLLPQWRHVLQPDVVLGRGHDAGRHDRQRGRAGGQEGRPDRLGRRRGRGHQRPDGRLHELLLEPRRARRRRERDRAGRLRLLRRHLPGGDGRPGDRLDERACRRSGGARRRRRRGRSTPRSPPRTRTASTTSTSTTASSTARVQVRPRDRQPGRQDGRGACDRPQGRRLPAAQADGRQRPDRRPRRPDRRPLHQADLARGRRRASSSSTTPRSHARSRSAAPSATASRPAAPARTGSRSTSPTTCCRGPQPTSRPRKPASSTRTPTSSRAATSSGPTASR